jgi:CRP-like cAMP-binding protein
MDEFQLLKNNLTQKIPLSDEEFHSISKFFVSKKVKKRKDILRVGEVCKQLVFVTKGVLRSYTIDEFGFEKVVLIALESHWISDLMSFMSGNPSITAIDAIEDSDVLIISKFDLERIYLEVPKMERFFRKLFENAYIAVLDRYTSVVTENAEARYKNLLLTRPDIIHRIPQVYIASYLGVTPETLSRLRKKIMEPN